MNTSGSGPHVDVERRTHARRHRHIGDIAFGAIRFVARHAKNIYAVFGIFLVSGVIIAGAATWAFAAFADAVTDGTTQRFDLAVMRWIGAHQNVLAQHVMAEVTSLGTGVVVTMIVLVAGMFLWLNKHRHSTILLIVTTVGGLVLDNVLKAGFNRPRPEVFTWGTTAFSSSFPSGHAMSAVVVYGTVAYLAARLQQRRSSRVLTLLAAAIIIILICASRLYLGVHYPSDILAGLIIGLAWAAFCMSVLEAAQVYARRNAPQVLAYEAPPARRAANAANAANAAAARRTPPPGKREAP